MVVLEDEAEGDPLAEAAAAAGALEASPEAAAAVAAAGYLAAAAAAAEAWVLLAAAAAVPVGRLDRCFFQTPLDEEVKIMSGHPAADLQGAGVLVPAAAAAVGVP